MQKKLKNEKHPELEQIFADYAEWYSLEDDYERNQWESEREYEGFGKIYVIKKVRHVLGFGLLEAKKLTELFEKKLKYAFKNYNPTDLFTEDMKLLQEAGFELGGDFSFNRSTKNKARMLRVGSTSEVKSGCEHILGKEVEWRAVGEYKIHIAKFCPECGKPIGG